MSELRDRIQKAINQLVTESSKITVSNVRRKMIELFGSAGNNNDLAPIVKEIKTEYRRQVKEDDLEETVAIAIKNSTELEIPVEIASNANKFVQLMYQELYNKIDAEISNEKINLLEQEINLLRQQHTTFPQLQIEHETLKRNYEQVLNQLVETNRLLEAQKVAEGLERVGEIERLQEMYDSLSNEMAELRTREQFATQRKNEISQVNQELREEITAKDNRIIELERGILELSDNQQTQLSDDDLAYYQQLEPRLLELQQQNENLNSQILTLTTEGLFSRLDNLIEQENLQEEISRNRTKLAKFINKLREENE